MAGTLVPSREVHRLVKAERIDFYDFPASVFDHIKRQYIGDKIKDHSNIDAVDAIHRCFSLARLYGAKMFVDELIPVKGQLAEDTHDFIYKGRRGEVEDINAKYVERVGVPEWDRVYASCNAGILEVKAQRISFWKKNVVQTPKEKRLSALGSLRDSDCIGYMILHKAGCFKNDDEDHVRWVVYESVIKGGRFQRGIIPRSTRFSFRVGTGDTGTTVRKMSGHLYCQQNGRTVVCAHVAIRTLLSSLLPERDVSYRKISELAGFEGGEMDTKQIIKVFNAFGFAVHVWSNRRKSGKDRSGVPIYHCLYSGIESGGGGLLGFDVKKPAEKTCRDKKEEEAGQRKRKAQPCRHIIPLFGHTFNKHIWVNEASGYYFIEDSGAAKSYVSDNWVSTFLGHDDNIGPNIYIPRFYVERFAVSSVFSIVPHRFEIYKRCNLNKVYLPGVKAEQVAVDWLLGIVLAKLEGWKVENIVNNDWIERLRIALTARQKNGVSDSHVARVVLRSVFLSRSQYRAKLLADQDAAGQCESRLVVDGVLCKQKVPTYIWMVEFSLPHLFPVNERKLGEIVLSAQADDHPETRGVLFVRLPSRYLIPNLVDGTAPLAAQSCLEQASQIISHMPCFRFAGAKRVG